MLIGDLKTCWLLVRRFIQKLEYCKHRVKVATRFNQKSIVNIEHQYNTLFYFRLHDFVSRHCIQHVVKELEKVKFIGSEKDACGCFIRTTHGLPCACQLAGIQIQGEHVLLESIHVFWNKLNIEEHKVTQEDR